jgi:hypothetical protein
MKLYQVEGALPYFVAKQDEAKRDARQLKCSWKAVEVPTTDGREKLAEFLNTLGGPASISIQGAEDVELPEVLPLVDQRAPAPIYSNKITELEEFILNEASVAQVEQLFARLGTRFKELASGNKLLD